MTHTTDTPIESAVRRGMADSVPTPIEARRASVIEGPRDRQSAEGPPARRRAGVEDAVSHLDAVIDVHRERVADELGAALDELEDRLRVALRDPSPEAVGPDKAPDVSSVEASELARAIHGRADNVGRVDAILGERIARLRRLTDRVDV